jgi:hypothetical protein
MASVKFKNLKRTLDIEVKKKLLAVAKDQKTLKEIAEFSVKRIKQFARSGNPLRDGKKSKFPPLSEVTPAIRKRLAKYNATHATYGKSGKKKNVTITGQLVEAVKYKLKRNVINVFIKGRRRKYRGKKGQVLKNADGSAQHGNSSAVYKDLVELDPHYKFLGMDKLGEKRIRNIIKRNLRRLLK